MDRDSSRHSLFFFGFGCCCCWLVGFGFGWVCFVFVCLGFGFLLFFVWFFGKSFYNLSLYPSIKLSTHVHNTMCDQLAEELDPKRVGRHGLKSRGSRRD